MPILGQHWNLTHPPMRAPLPSSYSWLLVPMLEPNPHPNFIAIQVFTPYTTFVKLFVAFKISLCILIVVIQNNIGEHDMAVRDLMRQQQIEQKTEVVSLRLSTSDLLKLDELATSLDVTRQRLITEMIKEGLDNARNLFEEEDVATEDPSNEKRYYFVNTNKANDPITHKNMLANGTAAAFLDPWKRKINRLKTGDVVFLYESGVGIVATGVASGKTEMLPYEGKADEEYRQQLSDYKRVKPFSAKEIKALIEKSLFYYNTMFRVSSEEGKKIEKSLEKL